MPAIFNDINWIDIVFVILLLGMIYKGSRTGVGGQILSLIGLLILIFFSIEYYNVLSEAIFGFMLQNWARPVSFLCIFAVMFTAIKVIERVGNVIGDEDSASIERIGGAAVAALRGFLLFGLIGILFLLIPLDFTREAVIKDSRTCMFFVNMDTGIYNFITEVLGKSKKRKSGEIVKSFLDSDREKYK